MLAFTSVLLIVLQLKFDMVTNICLGYDVLLDGLLIFLDPNKV